MFLETCFLGMCTYSWEHSYVADRVEVLGLPNLSHQECVCVPRNAHTFLQVHITTQPCCHFIVHQIHALTHVVTFVFIVYVCLSMILVSLG